MAARKTPSKGAKPDKLMREAISLELHQIVKDGRGDSVKRLRLVARALIEAAEGQDVGAIKEINDRMDGKVMLQVAGEDGGPLIVQVLRFAGDA